MDNIEIIQPGLLTTVQDNGRWGYQQYGMPVAGAMDIFSLEVANLLVGNHKHDAVLECTFLGPTIKFNTDEVISITGANMGPMINDRPIEMWKSIQVKADDILSFSGLKDGMRSYIAFSRKLNIEKIMNSYSTFLRGNLGGHEGGKLSAGQKISLVNSEPINQGSRLIDTFIPKLNTDSKIRVILGPQDDYFLDESIETFLSSNYKITNESDRMGYRLTGPKIKHKDTADIISDGIVFGSIQVPGHGEPIIMMADRQTTGGYTKIATIITPDLSKVAQMGPGSEISFEEVSIEKGQEEYIKYTNKMKDIEESIKENMKDFQSIRRLKLTIDNQEFIVDIEEI